ncbi:hypothetical protein HOY82DRAFT_601721 [Tuber indicum]|nr:hypothetical protein HOY82DRAFT_601721 [Tuber indicum]
MPQLAFSTLLSFLALDTAPRKISEWKTHILSKPYLEYTIIGMTFGSLVTAHFRTTKRNRSHQKMEAANDGEQTTAQLLAAFQHAVAVRERQRAEDLTPEGKRSTAQLLADFQLATAARWKKHTEALAPNSVIKAGAPRNRPGIQQCYKKGGRGRYRTHESRTTVGVLIMTAVIVFFLATQLLPLLPWYRI